MLRTDLSNLLSLEEAAGMETGDRPGGYNPKWTVRSAYAIQIIREERRGVRREKEYESEQDLKARLRKAGLEDG